MLPAAQLAEAARRALEADPVGALSYGDVAGYRPLREWFARQLGVDPERVLLTNGSLHGLSLLAGYLAGAGRQLIAEAPSYDFALRILRSTGSEPATVPLDSDGLSLDALEAMLTRHRSTALYTIPTFHNPSGVTMSATKRAALLELAADHDLLIVEDDPYRMLGIDGEPPPTLLSADRSERVIHLTSLTKTIAPGLRCGAMVLPSDLMEPLAATAQATYIAPGAFAQATAMAYIDSGAFEPGVELAKSLLRQRRDAAVDCLAGVPDVSWSEPAGGYFLWLELGREGARELAANASRAGVQVVPGNGFFLDGRSDRHMRIAFCAAPVGELREGLARLVKLLGRADETEPQPVAGG
jgi:2-aminoadipate transaminase